MTEHNNRISGIKESGAELFLKKYLIWSLRTIEYLTGLYFFALFTPYLKNLLPNDYFRDLIGFLLGCVGYQIIGWAVNKKYKPRFDASAMLKQDAEYKMVNEKLIIQMALYFVLQFCLTLLAYASGKIEPSYIKFTALAFVGSVTAFFHFFGVIMFIAAFYSKNSALKINQKITLITFGLALATPGIIYIIFSFYSYLRNFTNL